jgi:hypothetical protein
MERRSKVKGICPEMQSSHSSLGAVLTTVFQGLAERLGRLPRVTQLAWAKLGGSLFRLKLTTSHATAQGYIPTRVHP